MDTTEKNNKSCLSCGEGILAEARRCPYCGSLQNTGTEAVEPEPSQAAVESAAPADEETVPDVHNHEVKRDPQYNELLKDTPVIKKMSNGMKAFILTLCTIIPGFGQVAGIIVSIVLMNSEDNDRKTFGKVLLIAMLLVFLLSCAFYIFIAMFLVSARQ